MFILIEQNSSIAIIILTKFQSKILVANIFILVKQNSLVTIIILAKS